VENSLDKNFLIILRIAEQSKEATKGKDPKGIAEKNITKMKGYSISKDLEEYKVYWSGANPERRNDQE
ncbi:9214_t:CDS:2, partial [Gigaspora margarita]